MYRIRKMPNREEYCIYGKNGKLKYRGTRRDLAQKKLLSLLKQFWVDNLDGKMENPETFAFSETEGKKRKKLKCKEQNYQCGGKCQNRSRRCPSNKSDDASRTATEVSGLIQQVKGLENDIVDEKTLSDLDAETAAMEDAMNEDVGDFDEDLFGDPTESERLQQQADKAREQEDLDDFLSDREPTKVEQLESALEAALEREMFDSAFEMTEADELEAQARRAREQEDLDTAFDDDDDDPFAGFDAELTEADELEERARSAREQQDLEDFANEIENPSESTLIQQELDQAREDEMFDDFARVINGDLTESERLQEQADAAREREETEELAKLLGFSEPKSARARIAAFNEKRRKSLVYGDD